MHNETPTMSNQFDERLMDFRKGAVQYLTMEGLPKKHLGKKLREMATGCFPNEAPKTSANRIAVVKYGERFWGLLKDYFDKLKCVSFRVSGIWQCRPA